MDIILILFIIIIVLFCTVFIELLLTMFIGCTVIFRSLVAKFIHSALRNYDITHRVAKNNMEVATA